VEYRYLGRSGLKVSELCLGAMPFGREADETTSLAMLDLFAGAGGNFVDTANVYGAVPGASEEILGRWLSQRDRDDLVIATKVRWAVGAGPNDAGLSRKHILASIDSSLRRLRSEYVDLLYVHGWDPGTSLEEILSALDTVVRSGKARYLGVSNWAAWQIQKAIDLARAGGLETFVALQPLYNLLDREIEQEHIPVCLNEGLAVAPWSPLRGGWLSGRYRRGLAAPPADSRVEEAGRRGWQETWDAYANERTWRVLDELFSVSEAEGKSPAQVALNWLLQRPGVTCPIVGARNLEQLETNLGSVGWSLPEEHVGRLTHAGDQRIPHLYGQLSDPLRAR